jgi:hypothetical protein
LKILLVDSAYPGVLEEINSYRMPDGKDSFGSLTADFLHKAFGAFPAYKTSLERLGHEVTLLTPNQMDAQLSWSKEQGFPSSSLWHIFFRRWELFSRVPLFGSLLQAFLPVGRILESQIRMLKPDLVLIGDLSLLASTQVRRLQASTGAMFVGQIASPLPSKRHYEAYDLIVSAHPGIVDELSRQGLEARFLPLAFSQPASSPTPKAFASRRPVAAFVGSFGRHHKQNYPLLKSIAEVTGQLEIYGNPNPRKLEKFGLTEFYKGRAFGSDMFKVFGEVAVGINRHAKFADGYAVNMRMYEVAGSGAVLVTETAPNLHQILPSDSVVAYESFSEAAERIKQLLGDLNSASLIAERGMAHVLSQHSYDSRVQDLLHLAEEVRHNLKRS